MEPGRTLNSSRNNPDRCSCDKAGSLNKRIFQVYSKDHEQRTITKQTSTQHGAWHIVGPLEMVAIIISKWKGLINLKSSLVAACLHLSRVGPSGLLEGTKETNPQAAKRNC